MGDLERLCVQLTMIRIAVDFLVDTAKDLSTDLEGFAEALAEVRADETSVELEADVSAREFCAECSEAPIGSPLCAVCATALEAELNAQIAIAQEE